MFGARRRRRGAAAVATGGATLFVLAVLALAAPAAAKELTQATLCGADGCISLSDRATLRELPTGGERRAEQPPPSPYYAVELVVEHERERNEVVMWWIPSRNLLAANRETPGTLSWFPVYGEAIALMRNLTRELEPFATPRAWPAQVAAPGPGTSGVGAGDGISRPLWITGAAVFLVVGAAVLFLLARRRALLAAEDAVEP